MDESQEHDPFDPEEVESDWARRPFLILAALVMLAGGYFVFQLGPESGYEDVQPTPEEAQDEGRQPTPSDPGTDPAELREVDPQAPGVRDAGPQTDTPTDAPASSEARSNLDESDPGWGLLQGTAHVNGQKVPHGSVAWIHPESGERGQIPIQEGAFQGEAPLGTLDLQATVLRYGSLAFTATDEGQGLRGSLLQIAEQVVLEAEDSAPVALVWRFDPAIYPARVGFVPSGDPAVGQALRVWAPQFGEGFTRCPQDGRVSLELPRGYRYELGSWISGRWYGVALQEGNQVALELPDLMTAAFLVRDGVRGELTDDYDAFWRPKVASGPQARDWSPLSGLRLSGGTGAGRSAQLPKEPVQLLLVAPRRNLKPLLTSTAHQGESPWTFTLQAGGSIAFHASSWPDTGIIVDGPDPDPILIIEESLRTLPQGQSFAEWVAQPAVLERFPAAYFQERRIEFNRLGEAQVLGLPSGTYHLLHWRPDVRWAVGPITVREGLETQVTLPE